MFTLNISLIDNYVSGFVKRDLPVAWYRLHACELKIPFANPVSYMHVHITKGAYKSGCIHISIGAMHAGSLYRI